MVQPLLAKGVQASAFAHAGTRVVLGAAFLVAADRVGRPWLGSAVDAPGGRAALQAFAIRDVIIGLGTMSALRHNARPRTWFRLGLLAEAIDVPAALLAARRGSGAARPEVMTIVGFFGLAGGAFLSLALPPP